MDIQIYKGHLSEPLIDAKGNDEIVSVWLFGRPSNTAEAYFNDVQDFLVWTGNLHVTHIKVEVLQQYSTHLKSLVLETGVPYTPSTIARKLAALRSLFAFCYKARVIPYDLSGFVPPAGTPSGDFAITRILGEAEVLLAIYLEGKSGTRYATRNSKLIKFLYHTGLRVSELINLKWIDITLTDKGAMLNIIGKGNKYRKVFIQKSLLSEIEVGKSCRSPFVFSSQNSKDNGKLDRNTIYRIIKKAFKRAGVTKFASTHWLRHCCASHALQRGAPLSLVKDTLGHASVATTSRYLHSNEEDIGKYLP